MATEQNNFDEEFDYGDIAPLEPSDNTPGYGFNVRDVLSTPRRKAIATGGVAASVALLATGGIWWGTRGGDSHESDSQIRISELSVLTTEEPAVSSTIPEQIITIAEQPTTTMISVETAPATLPAGESLPEIAEPAVTVMIESSQTTATAPPPTAITLPPTTELVTTTTELVTTTTEAPVTTTEAPTTTEAEIVTVAETTEAPRTTPAPETTLWTAPEINIETPTPPTMPEWDFDCDESIIYVPSNVGSFWLESLAEACDTTVEQLRENSDNLDPWNMIAEQAVNLWPDEEPEETEPVIATTEAPETTIYIPETTEAPETTIATTEAPETTIAVTTTTTAATTLPSTTVAITPPSTMAATTLAPTTTVAETVPATTTTTEVMISADPNLIEHCANLGGIVVNAYAGMAESRLYDLEATPEQARNLIYNTSYLDDYLLENINQDPECVPGSKDLLVQQYPNVFAEVPEVPQTTAAPATTAAPNTQAPATTVAPATTQPAPQTTEGMSTVEQNLRRHCANLGGMVVSAINGTQALQNLGLDQTTINHIIGNTSFLDDYWLRNVNTGYECVPDSIADIQRYMPS